MAAIALSGLFATRPITGMERYAREVLRGLDSLDVDGAYELVIPGNTDVSDLELRNIPVRRIGHLGAGKIGGYIWEDVFFANYVRRSKELAVCFTNTVPFFAPRSVVVLHDLAPLAHPEYFRTPRKYGLRLRQSLNYALTRRYARHIVTVSEFSRSEITRLLGIQDNRITIAPPGWQHIEQIQADTAAWTRLTGLEPGTYYMSLSSETPNKNFDWVVRAARTSPGDTFIVAGGGTASEGVNNDQRNAPPNLLRLGYVSDEVMKAGLVNCKAFLFPSSYEGFGMPPLEALACGAPIVVANIPPCKEIFGPQASYLDPLDAHPVIPHPRVDGAASVLRRYDWRTTAASLHEVLAKLVNGSFTTVLKS